MSDARFAALYRDHFELVRRSARKLGGPMIEVDDVAQEVFLVAARRLHTYDANSARMTTWLYGITLNVVRSWRRRARSRISEDRSADIVAETHATIDGRAEEALDRALVIDAWNIAHRVLRQMSPAKREAYMLAEFAGLTCAEIGELVGVKEETIWSRLHYARREFRALLGRHGDDDRCAAA
ncbi:MAG TPA: RNA polymerase sigma factor [Polyangia bacterium]|jgi:RNA polymerase sigma-70 factor (ECF subfamily)|nr:RNA polymerase sigma factor [Polyangia bacterium]